MGALAVLSLGLAAFALTARPQSVGAAAQPTEDGAPVRAQRVAVFIGDSYTAGYGSSSNARRWSTLVAKTEGWSETNLGQGGTGYFTAAGEAGCGQAYCGPYADRLLAAIAANPDVVIVSGGQNDLSAVGKMSPAMLNAGVLQFYKLLRSDLPDATIVAVGPSVPGAVNSSVKALDAAVAGAAKATDSTYVSLLNPAVIRPSMVVADGAHVNDLGHEAIAKRVVSSNLSR